MCVDNFRRCLLSLCTGFARISAINEQLLHGDRQRLSAMQRGPSSLIGYASPEIVKSETLLPVNSGDVPPRESGSVFVDTCG